ncbi:MAG: sodium:proton antiporter [Microbacteriaceae bacterium]|nr:sodium:proton antiporter [Microbacteriaceae bacterium]
MLLLHASESRSLLASEPPPSTDDRAPHGRDESPEQRSDRNWNDILQELRVIQTGTQIISGFLLTIAFQPRFTQLDGFQVAVYLVLVVLAATSTALLLAPVSLHRTLFRHHEKVRMVTIANKILVATLWVVAILAAGVVLLVFDVVLGRAQGAVAGVGTAVILVVALIVLPSIARRGPKGSSANGAKPAADPPR